MRTLAKMGLLDDLVKQAVITREDHLKGLAREEAKALELAKLRGLNVPGGNKPNLENFRMSGNQPGPHPLMESEVVKAYNPHANSNLMRAKHRWLNPVKRFMHTTPGKALGIGAVGAAGLGLYSYLKNRQTPQPENYQLSPQDQMAMQQQMYPKMGAARETFKSVTIPRPPSVPRVSSPGPAIANAPQLKRDSASIGGFSPPVKEPGKDAMGVKKADIDPSIATLLAGGVGGGAGYMAGKHLVSPMIENKERDILKEIAEKQKSLNNWRSVRKYSPIGIAALGAVALASVAALAARKDERAKIMGQSQRRYVPYDPTGAGFGAADQVPMGSPYENAYDN